MQWISNLISINKYILLIQYIIYKAFRQVETLFVQGRNLVPSKPAIGWRALFTFRQPIVEILT